MPQHPSLIFQLAQPLDLETILHLWELSILNDYAISGEKLIEYKNGLISLFEGRNGFYNFWVAVDIATNEVVGWQSYFPIFHTPLKGGTAVESSTYIHPDYHKLGVAYELMKYALGELRQSELQFVYGFVNSYNKGAIQLVAKIGFIEIGTLPAFPDLFPYNFEKKLYLYEIHQ